MRATRDGTYVLRFCTEDSKCRHGFGSVVHVNDISLSGDWLIEQVDDLVLDTRRASVSALSFVQGILIRSMRLTISLMQALTLPLIMSRCGAESNVGGIFTGISARFTGGGIDG